MKKLNTLILILCTTLSAIAQINLNLEDITSKGGIGDTLSYKEANTLTVDIGTYGETSWDFSNITMSSKVFCEFLDATTTPFTNRYPEATIVGHQVITGNFSSDIYGYTSHSDSSIVTYGESISDNSGAMHIMFDPARELLFPLGFDSSWTYTGTETVIIGGTPDAVPLTVINSVDSYGELTLPSGKMVDALLLRSYEVRDFDGAVDTSKTFIFLTSDIDIIIMFLAFDQPNTGEVNVGSIIWYERTTTDVKNENELVNSFQLKQNYPNPFNPSTTIEYAIPKANNVELKIYNSLGKEVALLVNEFKPAGNYKIEFNATGLASGIYYARFKSGDYLQSVKLMLLK